MSDSAAAPSRHLALLLDELKQLKREGISDVYLSDEATEWLRNAATGSAGSQTISPKPKTNLSKSGTGNPVDLMSMVEEPSPKSGKPTQPTSVSGSEPISLPEPPLVDLPAGTKSEQWAWLKERVLACETCSKQIKPGKQVVFGVGHLDADIFFCGEAPGADEEVQGEPFVGPAGQLLNKIISAMGLSRETVYIGNIMNWRPDTGTGYGNRPPTREEMAFCLPYLQAQLKIVQPKVVVALGATAAKGLQGLETNPRMGDVRGNWFEVFGIPLMITYHPSYLLRNGTKGKKRLVWEDMLRVMEKLEMPISEKQQGYFL